MYKDIVCPFDHKPCQMLCEDEYACHALLHHPQEPEKAKEKLVKQKLSTSFDTYLKLKH